MTRCHYVKMTKQKDNKYNFRIMNKKTFKSVVLACLGLTALRKDEKGSEILTAEDRATLLGYGFEAKQLDEFEAKLNTPEREGESVESKQQAMLKSLLGQTMTELQQKNAELEQLRLQTLKGEENHCAAIAAKEAEITTLKGKVETLSDLEEVELNGSAAPAPAPAPAPVFNLDDDVQLGGMPGEFFSLDRPYNQRARAAMLAARGKMLQVNASTQDDFRRLQEDLGAFYLTPWDQRVRSFLVKLPSITEHFPTEPGHHDLEALVSLWLGEFSQAGNTVGSKFDNVAKGSFEFDTEFLRMYDVMFVHRFQDLKVLEKSWINYLNREGSDSLKLSFVEFILVEVAKKLHNERELRWVNGVRKNPDPNVKGRAMEAADGLYEYLRKKIEGFVDFSVTSKTMGKTVYQIKPFELPHVTQGNIGEVIYQGTSMIPAKFRDTGSVVLYIPSHMIPWYAKYNEMKYGQNTDYKANVSCVHEFPQVRIVAIRNADNHRRMFWTMEGNIKTYEGVSGEMYRFRLEQEDWTLKVWSEWREGIAAEAVGYKYADKSEMDGSRQLIWATDEDMPSDYWLEAEPGSDPSALRHNSILIPAPDGKFEITDVENAKAGEVISLKAGGEGISISKAGKFALISADWKPAKGDTIRLMKREDGKFIEIDRATPVANAYEFEADATTPSVAGATIFVTNPNTAATAITDLTDAFEGVVYTIHGAGKENASTIADGGKFALDSDMTLSEGTCIKLVKAADGKFHEVGRIQD